ncbi:MAG: hypothetical protein NVS2B17_18310 [Candidatus Velthaea sp.]
MGIQPIAVLSKVDEFEYGLDTVLALVRGKLVADDAEKTQIFSCGQPIIETPIRASAKADRTPDACRIRVNAYPADRNGARVAARKRRQDLQERGFPRPIAAQ